MMPKAPPPPKHTPPPLRFTKERRACRLPGCQASFLVPTSAKNKEFCTAEHRFAFHAAQRQEAMALLRKATSQEESGE